MAVAVNSRDDVGRVNVCVGVFVFVHMHVRVHVRVYAYLEVYA